MGCSVGCSRARKTNTCECSIAKRLRPAEEKTDDTLVADVASLVGSSEEDLRKRFYVDVRNIGYFELTEEETARIEENPKLQLDNRDVRACRLAPRRPDDS